jgi:hypothetical protein
MTSGNFCFYLQDRLIETSITGGQWYSDTSPFSIPWLLCLSQSVSLTGCYKAHWLMTIRNGTADF